MAHIEHMRRAFDTVIKTDTIFEAAPVKVASAKESLRREDMWKERWARIWVPDRAITLGTMRYGNVGAPDRARLLLDANKMLVVLGSKAADTTGMEGDDMHGEPTGGGPGGQFKSYAKMVHTMVRAFGTCTQPDADRPPGSPLPGGRVSAAAVGDPPARWTPCEDPWLAAVGRWLASTEEQATGTEKRLQTFLVKEAAEVADSRGGVEDPLAVRVAKLEAIVAGRFAAAAGGAVPVPVPVPVPERERGPERGSEPEPELVPEPEPELAPAVGGGEQKIRPLVPQIGQQIGRRLSSSDSESGEHTPTKPRTKSLTGVWLKQAKELALHDAAQQELSSPLPPGLNGSKAGPVTAMAAPARELLASSSYIHTVDSLAQKPDRLNSPPFGAGPTDALDALTGSLSLPPPNLGAMSPESDALAKSLQRLRMNRESCEISC